MKKSISSWIAFPIMLFFAFTCWAAEPAPKIPFETGEKLAYDIRWSGIPAGEAVLTVLPDSSFKGRKARRFEMTIKTLPFLDHFYKVRDKILSVTDNQLTRSLHYKKIQREGKTRRDVVVRFNWEKGQAQYSNFGKKKPPIPVMDGSFDPFSILYATRLLDLENVDTIRIPVTDGKKNIMGIATVLGKEKVDTQMGTFDTYLLETRLDEIGGVFEKCKDAVIRMWITADGRRLPVKLESEVFIGKFTGELISARNAGLEKLAGNAP